MNWQEECRLENLLREKMKEVDNQMYFRIRKVYEQVNKRTSISFIEFLVIAADEGRFNAAACFGEEEP